MKKRIIIMAVAIVLILSGCNPIGLFLSAVFESQDGDLRILYGRNGADYIYDHKVHLSYARGRREDYVGLYLDSESGKEQPDRIRTIATAMIMMRFFMSATSFIRLFCN